MSDLTAGREPDYEYAPKGTSARVRELEAAAECVLGANEDELPEALRWLRAAAGGAEGDTQP